MSFQEKVRTDIAAATPLSASQAWDPPATAATQGAEVSTTVSVPGANVGDPVVVGHSGIAAADAVILTALVATANTVTVNITNTTAAAVNVASGTLKVRVLK